MQGLFGCAAVFIANSDGPSATRPGNNAHDANLKKGYFESQICGLSHESGTPASGWPSGPTASFSKYFRTPMSLIDQVSGLLGKTGGVRYGRQATRGVPANHIPSRCAKLPIQSAHVENFLGANS